MPVALTGNVLFTGLLLRQTGEMGRLIATISDLKKKSAGGIPGTLFEVLFLAWMLLKVHLWHLPLDSVAGV